MKPLTDEPFNITLIGLLLERGATIMELRSELDRLRAENRQLTNSNAHLQQEVNFLRRRPE